MKKTLLLFMVCLTLLFSACMSRKEIQYYSERSNYITATGTVMHIKYTEDRDELYLGFDELSPKFSDSTFKISGKNLLIAQQNGIDQKLELGDRIEFISAPRYFGDGYVMPIVGINIDGEILLEFETGYKNWLEWIK